MTITLRIIGFHNCDGCSRKVENALRKIGVELMELDRESGNVIIRTAEPPEDIRRDLERRLKKSVIILSRDLVPGQNQNPNPVVSHRVPANGAIDVQELGQAAFRLAPVLNGVEISNTNTLRINFIHRENYQQIVRPERGGYTGVWIRDTDDEYASLRPPPRSPPWATTEPSAPLKPTEEQVVYGYPPDYYGVHSTRNHDDPNGCCNIM